MPNPQIPGQTLSQVITLLQITHSNAQEANRLRFELDQARASCYAYSLELQQTQAALADADAQAEPEAGTEPEQSFDIP